VQTVNLSIASAPSQGARRASGDGAEAGPQSARRAPDMEVVARATRRRFTNADRRRILAKADACTKQGEIGALLRREGVYSSSLATWRRKREAGELVALASQKRGPKVNSALADARRFEQLTRENQRLQSQLDKAMLVIDVQKKVSVLLGLTLPANPVENT
jgi:transposase